MLWKKKKWRRIRDRVQILIRMLLENMAFEQILEGGYSLAIWLSSQMSVPDRRIVCANTLRGGTRVSY